LTVADLTQLRSQLRNAGVRYKVVKNTLLRRAANEAGFPELADHFEGPTAVAMGPSDPIPVAKILNDFSERLELPKVRAFFVERKSYDPADVKKLAKLPSREVLLSQVVAAVQAPIAGFIGTLDGIIREFVGTLDAIARKKSA
jgi:large subunit ribosomal protein L10